MLQVAFIFNLLKLICHHLLSLRWLETIIYLLNLSMLLMIIFAISLSALVTNFIVIILRDLLKLVLNRTLPNYSGMVKLRILLVLLSVLYLGLTSYRLTSLFTRCFSGENFSSKRTLIALKVCRWPFVVCLGLVLNFHVLGYSLCLHLTRLHNHNCCTWLYCYCLLLFVVDWKVLLQIWRCLLDS